MAEQRHALNCSQRVSTKMTFSITKQNVVTGNKIAALGVLLFFIKIESLHSDDSKVKQVAYEYCARYFKSALRTEVMQFKKSVYNNRFSSRYWVCLKVLMITNMHWKTDRVLVHFWAKKRIRSAMIFLKQCK